MRYLHTMLRVKSIEDSLAFYCDLLGFVEISRREHKAGRFTLIFLAAPQDEANARETHAPMLELTYNWPSEDGEVPQYEEGRNFGHIALSVDDIYAICERLQQGGVD